MKKHAKDTFVDPFKGKSSFIGEGGVVFLKKNVDDYLKIVNGPGGSAETLDKLTKQNQFVKLNKQNFYNGKGLTNIREEKFDYEDLENISAILDRSKRYDIDMFLESISKNGGVNINKLLDIVLTNEEKEKRNREKKVRFLTKEKEKEYEMEIFERFRKKFIDDLSLNVFMEKAYLHSIEYASQLSETSLESLRSLSLKHSIASDALSSLGDLTDIEDDVTLRNT